MNKSNGISMASPRIFVTPDLLSKFQAYINTASPYEISGLGEIEILERDDFLIAEFHLFAQEVTISSTELNQDALFDFLDQAVESGFDLARIKLWWHSHGNSPVSWSHQDRQTIGFLSNSTWMISIVGNTRGEYLARLDIYKPVHITHNLTMHVLPQALTQNQLHIIEEEVAKKVTVIEPPLTQNIQYAVKGCV